MKDKQKVFKYRVGVFSGDIVYFLPGIKKLCEEYNTQAEIYIWLDRPWGDSVEGQKHPYGVNQYALDMMKPLLESQQYIKLCKKWEGEPFAVDLDELRTMTISTMPHGCITQWPGQVWRDMISDTSRPWINLTELAGYLPNYEVSDKILVNRTSRWRNDHIHYYYLREYKDKLMFVGLKSEHEAFCKEWDLDIPLYEAKDFLDLAITIRSCRLFIGNQSLCFALAEAMKVPRLLEVCRYAPNVIPSGPNAWYFIHQANFEGLLKELDSKF